MRKSESITEYAKAFCKAQLEVKQPLKDKDNPFFQKQIRASRKRDGSDYKSLC